MPARQTRPFASSHNARPRQTTTRTNHFSKGLGSFVDRVSRSRHESTRIHQLTKREQQAVLEAIATGGVQRPGQAQRQVSEVVDPEPSNLNSEQIDRVREALGSASARFPTPVAGCSAVSLDDTLIAGESTILARDLQAQNMSATAYMLPVFGHMDPFSSNYQSAYQTGASYDQTVPRASQAAAAYAVSYTASPRQSHPRPVARPQRGSYASAYQAAPLDAYLSHASAGQTTYGYTNPSTHLASYSGTLGNQDIASAAYGTSYSISNPSFTSAAFDSHLSAIHSTPSGYISGQAASSYHSPQAYGVGSSSDAAPGTPEDPGVRVLNSRPKPQCWDHGCNGRHFSTFSNLLRHQREKSGTAAKSVCPRCGAEFTRTTARNGHMAHDKCKRKSSTTSVSGAE